MKKYIYDKAGWTEMKIDTNQLLEPLNSFYHAQGLLFGKLDALGFDVQNELLINAISDEVVTSSEIEGEILDRSDVRSSVARRLGLEIAGLENTYASHYTEGVVEMVLDATRNYYNITAERLFGWHCALFPTGRSGFNKITVGAYRTSKMEIVSGPSGKERVHYIAPKPERVPHDMDVLLNWLETYNDIDPYIKSAVAHLWFESIHPFDDGNGRIGRAISDHLLARAEKSINRYYSLSSQLLKERKSYYNELEVAQKYSGDLNRWVIWFVECLTRAVLSSITRLETAKQKAALFDKLRSTALNERQNIMINKLVDGFEGKLTTSKWAKICKCSDDTALRDIDDLINKGVLLRSPEGGRSTAYCLFL